MRARALPAGLVEKLVEVQRALASKVILEDAFRKPIRRVAGLDVSFKGELAFGACVLMSYPGMEVLEISRATSRPRLPYIPGLLAFREVPVMLKALRGLKNKPDVVLVDAQGIAHPRRCGEATHLGLVARTPTVGVAKRVLCGRAPCWPTRPDSWAPLYHEGEPVGFIYLSKAGCRPLVVSPGHMVSLASALEITRSCLKGHKLPEPTRLAHVEARRAAEELS